MVDRGIDNVYLLTGGIQDFVIDYPSYIEGKMPHIKQPSPTSRRANKNNKFRPTLVKVQESENDLSAFGGLCLNSFNLAANNSTYRSPVSSRRPSKVTHDGSPTYSTSISRQHRDDKSEAGRSIRSNFSVAESIISRAQSRRGKF